jgi:hypothetical protein
LRETFASAAAQLPRQEDQATAFRAGIPKESSGNPDLLVLGLHGSLNFLGGCREALIHLVISRLAELVARLRTSAASAASLRSFLIKA